MQIILTIKQKYTAIFQYLFLTLLLSIGYVNAYAAPIILHGNQVISTPTTYNNVVVDMTDARFTVNAGGSLTLKNSIINVTISASNPYFIMMNSGGVDLTNTTVNVKVNGIAQDANSRALYKLINIVQGNINLSKNKFTIDTPFTVSLFETQSSPTSGFMINGNSINQFHGGFYLTNSNNPIIEDNTFSNVSFSNIYYTGNFGKITGNLFTFAGNLKLGNAIDIVNADGLTVTNNVISSGSNYGISITGANNLFIENNKISDNKSYGIVINTPTLTEVNKNKYLSQLVNVKKSKFIANSNIVISNNYIAQNKFGLTGGIIDRLIVTNNTFIQRFADTSIRQYWTDNNILLPSVADLTWIDNVYKEAFTQENGGDNRSSLKFVSFPARGGVYLE